MDDDEPDDENNQLELGQLLGTLKQSVDHMTEQLTSLSSRIETLESHHRWTEDDISNLYKRMHEAEQAVEEIVEEASDQADDVVDDVVDDSKETVDDVVDDAKDQFDDSSVSDQQTKTGKTKLTGRMAF